MELSLSLYPSREKRRDLENSPAKLVGYFSRNFKFKYVNNLSQLSYLTTCINDVPLDLSRKFNVEKWPDTLTDEIQPANLHYFIEHKDIIRDFCSSKLEDVGFIFTTAPFIEISRMFFDRKPVILHATLFRGIIYLETKMTNSQISGNQENISHKFSHCILSGDPNTLPNTNETIYEVEEFFGVFQRDIHKHKIMCSALIDGIFATKGGINAIKIPEDLNENDTLEELRKRAFIRLKTAFYMAEHSFRRNITKNFWIESLLTTVTDFFVGFFNDNKIIKTIKHFTIDDILRMRREWDPEECLDFFDKLFDFIKMHFKREIEKRKITTKDNDIKTIPIIQLTFSSENGNSVEIINSQMDNFELPDFYIEEISKFL